MTEETKKITPVKIIFTFIYILLFPTLLLLLSGDVYWPEGWVFSGWYSLLCFSTIIYLYRKDPALLAERYKKPGTANQKAWDKFVVYGLVVGFTTWIIIMPLDAKRFGWTPGFPLGVKATGGAALIVSFFFFYRSFTDNTFLSPLVRVQSERKQKVVTTGVYGFVRHPMYLAAIFMFIGTPFLLGSCLGIVAGLLLTVLIAFRTKGEEQMLLKDLEGYDAYQQKVKYRFFPFMW